MKKWAGVFITALLTASFLLFYYSDFFLKIDKRGPGSCCDGQKNYYTVAYYVKYDSGFHFTGMNYPYGEHIVFTDNQPAVSFTLKFLNQFFPSISNHIHAILAWVAFISIVVSAIVIHLTFLELNTAATYSIMFSFLIACLSPQITRIPGHYSLAYFFVIPLLNYYLVRVIKNKYSIFLTTFIVLTITTFGFIHPYYLAIVLFYFFFASFS